MLQLMCEGCSYTPLSIARYSFIQLSELEQCSEKNPAQGFNNAAQDSNMRPLSWKSEADPLLSPRHCRCYLSQLITHGCLQKKARIAFSDTVHSREELLGMEEGHQSEDQVQPFPFPIPCLTLVLLNSYLTVWLFSLHGLWVDAGLDTEPWFVSSYHKSSFTTFSNIV